MFLKFLLLVSALIYSHSLLAMTPINASAVIKEAVVQAVHQECHSCRVEMKIMNSQILDDIAVPDRVIADHWKGQVNLVLELGEENRIITADIRWIDQVIVAKENIKMGEALTAKDLETTEQDVTFFQIPYARNMDHVIGLIGKRMFRRGQIIDESQLKKPIAVRYGQPIKAELVDGSLTLTIDGQAKGAGAIGEDIPIYLPNTRKKMQARIISEGLVRVL
jgi:flagella basal body P-ring formation protein FlgA